MLLRAMRETVPESFTVLVERRAGDEPVAYIIGAAEFYGLTLAVSPAVLIPRGDSETLVEAALGHAAPTGRALDLGTGSGALLLALLANREEWEGVGIDASAAALAVASCNAAALGLSERCHWHQRDWCKPGWTQSLGAFDLILANPPYVETDAALDAQVRNYEPHCALFAGSDGLDDYRILVPQLGKLLVSGGVAIVEVGASQAEAVSAIAAAAGFSSALRHDLAGRPRALLLWR